MPEMKFQDLLVVVLLWVLSTIMFHHSLRHDRYCHRYDYVYLASYPCPLEDSSGKNTTTPLQVSALEQVAADCVIHRMNCAGMDGRWPVLGGEIMAKCLH